MDIHAVCEEVSKQQYYARQRYYAVCIGPESLLLLLASVLQTASAFFTDSYTRLLCHKDETSFSTHAITQPASPPPK